MSKRRIYTICGSLKFQEQMLEQAEALSVNGVIVLMPNVNMKKGMWIALTANNKIFVERIKADLDEMHKDKIDMSTAIFVVNVGGYLGESTLNEIRYAEDRGIDVIYMEDITRYQPVPKDIKVAV